MVAKQSLGGVAPDGSNYITLTDGAGNLNLPIDTAVSGTLTATGNLFVADMKGYNSISVQVTSAGTTCTITYETSDDNTNWVSTTGFVSTTVGTTAPASTSTTAVMTQFPRRGRYFRARVSTYTSGTVTVAGTLSVSPAFNPYSTASITSAVLGAGTANVGFIAGGIGGVTSNGLTLVKLIAANTTNATSVKASAGKVVTGYVFNTSAATKYLKFYNKASAPTVGTDTPVWTIPIAPSAGVNIESVTGIYGLYFATGVAYALTGAAADADTTALAAGDVIVNLGYI